MVMPPPPPTVASLADATSTTSIGQVMLCALAIAVGGCLVAYAIAALWEGERVGGLRPTSVASVAEGRVVLSGVAEPAWAFATSPFGKKACVWYDAKSTTGAGRLKVFMFRERNAVPFVLNDGTGRILVLARRARWDAATDPIARGIGADEPAAVHEGRSDAEVSRLLAGPHQEPPPCLVSHVDHHYSQEQIDAQGRENSILVGERVTVVGRATPNSPAAITEKDACADGGQSLGLPATYVIGPGPFVTGLDVLAGSPSDVTRRAWVHLLLGLAGAAAILAAVVVLATS
jgi:hypothetical protein